MRWIAATLVGLLGLSYALIVLAAPEATVRPAPHDAGIGGLSIFSSSLRKAGYRVAYDGSTRPHFGKEDIAVVPVLDRHSIPKAALDFVREGGRAFVIGVPSNLQAITGLSEVQDSQGRKAKVDLTELSAADPLQPAGWLVEAPTWSSGREPLASLEQVGKGRIARLDYGALATNRFLGRADNAQVVLSTLGTIAEPRSSLVFIAGGYGEDSAPGPFEAIGPWAVGVLWQSLGILAAFGIARGIRFGLSAPETVSQRGARELLDTVASHYRRGKRTDAPIAAAARERSDDYTIQALATRSKVSEAEARQALIDLESRPKRRPS